MPRQKDTYLNREGLEYYHRKIKQEFASQEDLNNLSQVVNGKQDQLTSANAGDGINITVDQSGKVTISNTNVSAEWGNIQGDITNQVDLINYIKQNGGKIDGISVNGVPQSIINKVVDIDVPTKTSELINDSNFVSDENYVHTDNNFTSEEKNKLNSIEEGAEVNVLEGISIDGVIQPITNKIVNISTSTYTAGNGIDITNDVISIKNLILDCGTSTTIV